jgi:hypothetical protein
MAQDFEDRPVGIFLGYAFTNALNPEPDVTQYGPPITYTYTRLHAEGGDLGLYITQNPWLRWRADGAVTGFFAGTAYLLGGPEFTARVGRGVFFAHGLAGYGEVEGGLFSPSRNGFALAFGGGVDIRLFSHLSLRLVDADYLPSHFSGDAYAGLFPPAGPVPKVSSWENNTRITAGVIVKFGKKF